MSWKYWYTALMSLINMKRYVPKNLQNSVLKFLFFKLPISQLFLYRKKRQKTVFKRHTRELYMYKKHVAKTFKFHYRYGNAEGVNKC